MNEKAVFCIAKSLRQAEQMIEKLRSAGFSNDDISILYSDSQKEWVKTDRSTMFAEEGTVSTVASERELKSKRTGGLGTEKHSKAPEGAATGATAGGVIGGTLGLLAGIGSLAIPGMGPFIAAGPIMAAIAGSGIGGSIGLLTGALVGLGIPEYEAVHYAEKLKESQNILISVHTQNSEEVNRAKEIFQKNGGEDIACSRETTASGKGKR